MAGDSSVAQESVVAQESSVTQGSTMSPESAVIQESSAASHQDGHKSSVPPDSDAYMRWRLAWEKQRAREDRSIQELDRKIAALKNNLPQRGGRSRSRSPGPS